MSATAIIATVVIAAYGLGCGTFVAVVIGIRQEEARMTLLHTRPPGFCAALARLVVGRHVRLECRCGKDGQMNGLCLLCASRPAQSGDRYSRR